MISEDRTVNIDPDNKIERNYNGCNVRLFFVSEYNEKVERQILDHLMLVFVRRMQESSNVQS